MVASKPESIPKSSKAPKPNFKESTAAKSSAVGAFSPNVATVVHYAVFYPRRNWHVCEKRFVIVVARNMETLSPDHMSVTSQTPRSAGFET